MFQTELIPNLNWEFQMLYNDAEVSSELLTQCLLVCVDGFGMESSDWVNDNHELFSTSTIFGRLLDEQEKLYGIAYYSIPAVPLSNNSYILWEDGICLVKSAQNKGYSKDAIKRATSLFPERQFNWFGCRTQNPNVMSRYSKMGRLFPFDELYNSPTGQIIMEFLLENILEVRTTYQTGKLNIEDGICTKLYPQGRLGDYLVDLGKVKAFEDWLQKRSFHREQGDAVILVCSLNNIFKTHAE